jgi:hypothetical protein
MCQTAHAALADLGNKVKEARKNSQEWATALGDVADGANSDFPAHVREFCGISEREIRDAVAHMLEVERLLAEFYASHPQNHEHHGVKHSHA